MRIPIIVLCAFYYIFLNDNLEDGFVYLKDIDDSIIVDLKYYSSENFTARFVDGYLANKAILTNEAGTALSKAQKDFNKLGYSLILYDAYRPQSAVDFFVRWSANLSDTIFKNLYYPDIKKSNLFELGYIAYKSGHSRGSTIDVSLVDMATNREIDMGTIFDYFGIESHTFFDKLSENQKANRLLLYEVMTDNGFNNYPKEWWHYTLENEPFQKYFDFPIQ